MGQDQPTKQKPGCLASLMGFFGTKTTYQPSTKKSVEYLPPDQEPDPEPLPYCLRDDFLSPAEKSFYHVLKSMMGSTFTICTKVSLADIFFVVRPNENKSAYNRINRKHVDFLICEPNEMKPLFAVELDDSSHDRPDRMERDAFVDDVFEAAELPVLHIPVKASYNTNELGSLFRKALEQSGFLKKAATQKNDPQQQILDENRKLSEKNIDGQSAVPRCPKCDTPMVLRIAKNGNQPGRKFYGCSNYPKCRMIIPFDEGN